MKLIKTTQKDVIELMTWFKTQEALTTWAGPFFNYPFDKASFIKDLKLNTLASYSLINANDDLIAFGQYYSRLGNCHLGRLVVNPRLRRQGIASTLINNLSEIGKQDLQTRACSLFVYEDNQTALNIYRKIGFIEKKYPDKIPLENCLYMVK